MRTLLVTVVGVTSWLLSACGGEVGFTPWEPTDDGAAAASSAEQTAAANTAAVGSSSQGSERSVASTASGGAGTTGSPSSTSRPAGGGGSSTPTNGVSGGTSAVGVSGGTSAVGVSGGTSVVGVSGGTSVAAATGGRSAVGTAVAGSTSVVVGSAGGTGLSPFLPVGGGMSVAEPPPPSGCEPAADYPESDYCSFELSCDNDYVSTYCQVMDGDTWYCSCSSSYRYLDYEVQGVKDGTLCRTMADVCGSADPQALMGEETCTNDYASAQTDYCEIQEQCRSSVTLSSGATASLVSWRYSNCSEYDGRLRCSCNDYTTSRSYDISGLDSRSSCQLALDLCSTDQDAVFDGPMTCESDEPYGDDTHCELYQECWQSTEVRDNVTALLFDGQYFSCYEQQPNVSYCDCGGSQWSFGFEVSKPMNGADSCVEARDVCTRRDEIVSRGDVLCERSSQSASTGSCDAQITCSEPAAYGDLEFTLKSSIYLYCNEASSGAWRCTCSAGMQNEGFDVEAAESWDVCTEAADRCPDLVDPESYTSGGFYWGGI